MPGSQAICRRELGCRQPEVAENGRDRAAIMIAGQKERRAARRIMFNDRRSISAAEE